MRARAYAKINLAHVVGPRRPDGKHEVVTVLEHLGLHDVLELRRIGDESVVVDGYPDDTLVRAALERVAAAARTRAGWHVRVEKRIPVAAGLGGGSSDAAVTLRLANAALGHPLAEPDLAALAAELGADVPFFLASGPQLGTGDGARLTPLSLPQDYHVLLVLPRGEQKETTAAVYDAFDARGGETGFSARRDALLRTVQRVAVARDLRDLPGNDLSSSPLAEELERRGAFRADVTGAGPAVYALFEDRAEAEAAARHVDSNGSTWLTRPVAGL